MGGAGAALDATAQLHDAQGAGHPGEEEPGDRGDEQRNRDRDLTVPGEEAHRGASGVLGDEDDQQDQHHAQSDDSRVDAAGARTAQRVVVVAAGGRGAGRRAGGGVLAAELLAEQLVAGRVVGVAHARRYPRAGRHSPSARGDEHHGGRAESETEPLRAVHPLAQHHGCQDHGDGRVERGDDRRHAEVAVVGRHLEEPGRQRAERTTDHPAERPGGARHPVLAQGDGDGDDREGRDELVECQWQEPRLLGHLGERREEAAEPQAGEHAVHDAGRAGDDGDVLRAPRDQPDRGQGQQEAEPHGGAWALSGQQADEHGDRHGTHSGDGRDDAHPARGEAAVEERRAEPVAESGRQGPGEVDAAGGAAVDQGDQQHEDGPAELREQGDGPGAAPLGEDPAAEVAEAVRRRREQRQHHGHVASTPATHARVATTPAASSIRMLSPTARRACFVEGQARCAPSRRCSAA